MFYGIEVYVPNQVSQVTIVRNFFSSKILEKQGTASFVNFIECLRIATEEIGEPFADKVRLVFQLFQSFEFWKSWGYFFPAFNLYQQVKMVFHQTPGHRIRYRVDVLMVFLQEKIVILFFPKQVVIAIAVVENMVVCFKLQH